MSRKILVDEDPAFNRQREIDQLEIGAAASMSRRIDLEFGVSREDIISHKNQVRAALDQAAFRAKRKESSKEFLIEGVEALTYSGALVLTAVCTRIL